jgi:hypothetical protein
MKAALVIALIVGIALAVRGLLGAADPEGRDGRRPALFIFGGLLLAVLALVGLAVRAMS